MARGGVVHAGMVHAGVSGMVHARMIHMGRRLGSRLTVPVMRTVCAVGVRSVGVGRHRRVVVMRVLRLRLRGRGEREHQCRRQRNELHVPAHATTTSRNMPASM